MPTTESAMPPKVTAPDLDALLCALVLVPRAYARNQFFQLFEQPQVRRVRRRAKRVRGIIRQLLGQGREPAEIVGEQVLDDRVLLRFQVSHLKYQRTTSLTLLEAALIHYALHKYKRTEVLTADRDLVETALQKLNHGMGTDDAIGAAELGGGPDSLFPEPVPAAPDE